MKYGLQLYSIRDLTEKDFDTAIRRVAELGYSFVEPAGFFGKTADEFNALLREYNLNLSGTHSAFDDLLNHFDETIAFHKAIKNPLYIIPAYKLTDQERLDRFVAAVNEISPRLKKEGITLAYHNHAKEFIPNEDGSVPFEQLYYRTELMFEIDTYWAYVGMKNPVGLLNRVKDRVLCIHIKDGYEDGSGMPLGMGTAPVKEIYYAAKRLGLPMIVESETCNPDGITEAEICIKYLRRLES